MRLLSRKTTHDRRLAESLADITALARVSAMCVVMGVFFSMSLPRLIAEQYSVAQQPMAAQYETGDTTPSETSAQRALNETLSDPTADPVSDQWQAVASRVSMLERRVGPAYRLGFNPKLTALRIEARPSELRILLQPSDRNAQQLTAKQLCELYQHHICINANFFDEHHKPLGLVISAGRVKNPLHNQGSVLTGVFYTNAHQINIVHRAQARTVQPLEALQAGPRLISSGEKVAGLQRDPRQTKRSGICLSESGALILWVVHGGFGGISLSTLQEILLAPTFSCFEALNLDGGGSTQLFVSNSLPGVHPSFPGLSLTGQGPVPIVLGLRLDTAEQ